MSSASKAASVRGLFHFDVALFYVALWHFSGLAPFLSEVGYAAKSGHASNANAWDQIQHDRPSPDVA
jgi:hypothetical protein